MKRSTTTPSRLRNFVFTLNNYTAEEEESIKNLNVKWLIFGHEIGEEENTPHLQGACVIGRQVAFSTLKTWPGLSRAHLAPMLGSAEDNVIYCTKQDSKNFFEKGDRPKPGKRTDLLDVVQSMRNRETFLQIASTDEGAVVIVKYARGLTLLRQTLQTPRTTKPQVVWLSGTTGIGKTRTAIEVAEKIFGQNSFWISSGSLRWFDGYENQPVAILDDFRAKDSTFSFLLRLLDRYPLKVEIKGAFVEWNPKLIIITAPQNPTRTWSFRTQEQIDQLNRRIDLQCEEEVQTLSQMPYTQNTGLVLPLLPGAPAQEAQDIQDDAHRNRPPNDDDDDHNPPRDSRLDLDDRRLQSDDIIGRDGASAAAAREGESGSDEDKERV